MPPRTSKTRNSMTYGEAVRPFPDQVQEGTQGWDRADRPVYQTRGHTDPALGTLVPLPVSAENAGIPEAQIARDHPQIVGVGLANVAAEDIGLVPGGHGRPLAVPQRDRDPFAEIDAVRNPNNEGPVRLEQL